MRDFIDFIVYYLPIVLIISALYIFLTWVIRLVTSDKNKEKVFFISSVASILSGIDSVFFAITLIVAHRAGSDFATQILFYKLFLFCIGFAFVTSATYMIFSQTPFKTITYLAAIFTVLLPPVFTVNLFFFFELTKTALLSANQ